jgi:peptidoglycan biosynthesis protein MviN/MurJ (putative lipid II flippase)
MLGELFFGVYYNLSVWYKLTDETKWGAYFSIAGCLLTVSVILLFAPAFGYMACAWASFAGNLLMMVISYLVGQKKYPVSYDLRSAFIYFAVAAALFAAGMLPRIDALWMRLAYRSLLLFLFVCVIGKGLPLREMPVTGKWLKRK